MTASRAAELARVIRSATDVDGLIVLEDDHSGLISTEGDVTLGISLPNRVVHVRSFSKSHGPDLRIAALRRFAVAITLLNLAGYTFLGFEQAWAPKGTKAGRDGLKVAEFATLRGMVEQILAR